MSDNISVKKSLIREFRRSFQESLRSFDIVSVERVGLLKFNSLESVLN